jgi:hypothetical protein
VSGESLTFTPGVCGSGIYSAESSGAIDKRTFAPRGDVSADPCSNQTVFIRGLKISCGNLIDRTPVGPVGISRIVPRPGNLGDSRVRGFLGSRTLDRMFSWFMGGGHGGNQPQLMEDQPSTQRGIVNVECFPNFSKVNLSFLHFRFIDIILPSHTIHQISSIRIC